MESVFRKKSMDRISSPEQLDQYIRVTSPGVWLILAAIVALLAGIVVWGFLGKIDSCVTAVGIAENGQLTVILTSEDMTEVTPGMEMLVEEEQTTLPAVSAKPCKAGDVLSEFALFASGLDSEDYIYVTSAPVNTGLLDGAYEVRIITETISPAYFLFN